MKYSKWIGLFACITLIIACFSPWTFHADLNKSFTGFYSEQNMYGKPGKYLVIFAMLSVLLIFIPKIWAKRFHLFLSALALGFAIRTYILFVSCYNAYCPDKKIGIFLMLFSTLLILIVSFFPHVKMDEEGWYQSYKLQTQNFKFRIFLLGTPFANNMEWRNH